MNKNFIKSISIVIFVLILSWFFFLRNILDDIETLTYDWRARIATEKNHLSHHDPDIVLLAANDETTKILENYPSANPGRWPWQRDVWGDVVKFISTGKPKAIIFDLKFEGSDNSKSDNYFAHAVKNKGVVIGTALSLPRSSAQTQDIIKNLRTELVKYHKELDQ